MTKYSAFVFKSTISATFFGLFGCLSLDSATERTIALCSAGAVREVGVDLSAEVNQALAISGGRIDATFRNSFRGAFLEATGYQGETAEVQFREYINCAMKQFALEHGIKPGPTGSINLHNGPLPSVFYNGVEKDQLTLKVKTGLAPNYRMALVSDITSVRATLPYKEAMQGDGAILLLDPGDFYFPAPILGVAINNPSENPVAISEIQFRSAQSTPTRIPWLTTNAPTILDDGSTEIVITDYGWRRFISAEIEFSILSVPEQRLRNVAPELFQDNGTGAFFGKFTTEIQTIEKFPEIQFNHDFELSRSTDGIGFAPRQFRFPIPRLEIPSDFSDFAFIYGNITFEEMDGSRLNKNFLTILEREQSDRVRDVLYPSFAYNAFFDADDLNIRTEILPVAFSIQPGHQEYFLISVDSNEPAIIDFEAFAITTDNEDIPLGRLSLETFFTNYLGANGDRVKYEGPLLSDFSEPIE